MKRNIEDILLFRTDLSPFLVHLTRSNSGFNAKLNLESIVKNMSLRCGEKLVSDARFGVAMSEMEESEKQSLFSAICFTETPINEIHCLLEISSRQTDLEEYGLLFVKENLKNKGVSPVLHINNVKGDKDTLFQALCSLKDSHPVEAKQILPLISVFGEKIQPTGTSRIVSGEVDFTWEREWRYPQELGELSFSANDVFVGLCRHDEIEHFEALWNEVGFVDPKRNLKWYAKKLIDARQRLDLKYSVV